MGLARHVALMDKIKNAISGLVGKYEGEEFLLDDLYVDQTNILKWMLNRVQWRIVTNTMIVSLSWTSPFHVVNKIILLDRISELHKIS